MESSTPSRTNSTPSTSPNGAEATQLSPQAQRLLKGAQQWLPKTRAQWEAIHSPADLLLFGGAAGSLKSATILLDAVQEFRIPDLSGIIFRESYPNLAELMHKAHSVYQNYPYYGDWNQQEKTWRFPVNAAQLADINNLEAVANGVIVPEYVKGQGARIMFRYLANDEDVYNYQSFEFSFIAFDESTHHSEFQIQYMLTRLRSTNPELRQRMRLGTNPGGQGHDFHLKFFLGGHCPHCDPQFLLGGKRPYLLYTDAKFSDGTAVSQRGDDGKMIERTTQFIPGNVSDHELFGKGNEAYKSNLRLQRASTAAALLAGCWSVFEGQYFSCWEENRGVVVGVDGTRTIPQPDMRMVVPRKDLNIEHWWPHFTGTDYGFTISAAASYLFVRVPKSEFWPNGRVYVLDEVVRQGILAEDLARLLLQRWFLEEVSPGKWGVPEKPKAIMMWALSPDAWIKSGIKGDQDVPLTRADQMNAILGPYRMGFSQANNDRQGRWQHIYRGLRSGELVICDTCPRLIEAIPSRIHDPDKEDDIFKAKGSALDDCMDAFGYGYYTWTREPVKPIDLQRAEVMQGLDPTSAMINKARFDAQQRPKNVPVFFGPGAQRRKRQWEAAHRNRQRR